MPLSVRQANESSTSRTVTSTMTPRERELLTRLTRSSCNVRRSASVRAAWIDAIRVSPCLRIGTCIARSVLVLVGRLVPDDLVTQDPLGYLQAALEVADGI